MAYSIAFQGHALNYPLTKERKGQEPEAMTPYLALDNCGRTTIRTIYCDTDPFVFVLDKPKLFYWEFVSD